RALAEIALDLRQRGIERLRFIHGGTFDKTQRRLGHASLLMTGIRRTDNARRRQPEVAAMYTICSQFAICSGRYFSAAQLTRVSSPRAKSPQERASGPNEDKEARNGERKNQPE